MSLVVYPNISKSEEQFSPRGFCPSLLPNVAGLDSLDLQCKALQVLVVGNILVDSFTNDPRTVLTILFSPFGVIVLVTTDLLWLEVSKVSSN